MWPKMGQKIGTHYYNNEASVLDQFLVSKGLLTGKSGFTADIDSVEILRFSEMVATSRYPKPVRFNRGDSVNLDGFSDHFPISMMLQEK